MALEERVTLRDDEMGKRRLSLRKKYNQKMEVL